ncbi:hypothetical protein NFI96_023795, partial [Prochilodus magdalenae]
MENRNVTLTWTNQISAQTSASKTHTVISPQHQSLRWRDRELFSLLSCVLWCAAGVLFSRISGAEVEMRVRPGDSVTLYCDCVWKVGFTIVWFRNCSHHHQPPLVISMREGEDKSPPRYSTVWNPSTQTHDLLVKNVSESDPLKTVLKREENRSLRMCS